MKRLILLFGVLTVITWSCQKKIETLPAVENELEIQQQGYHCGMEEAMAKMPDDWKREMLVAANKNAVVASELLLYLDFDGAVVVAGPPNATGYRSPIITGVRNCPPPSLSPAQIEEVIALVADDFSPFKIKITTDIAEFNAYPAPFKQISIITTLPAVIGMSPGVAGVSPWGGPQTRLPFNPCFIFANLFGGDLADIAAVISHESAHSLGLDHQNRYNNDCVYIGEYHFGFGSGPLSFAPIMGIGQNKRVTNWYAQPCIIPFSNMVQNDFDFIRLQVELKEDDFPNTATGNSVTTEAAINGVLEQEGDVDFIGVNFKGPGPVTVSSENADIKVSVYTNGGHLVAEYNDPGDTGVTIPSVSGKRYLRIEAVSNANMSAQFMTGKYKIVF